MEVSVLFRSGSGPAHEPGRDPDYFADLHLDRVLAEVNRHCEVELNPWLRGPLGDPDDIAYRQAVFSDLQGSSDLRSGLDAYVQAMHRLRSFLALGEGRRNQHESEGWFLHAARHYLTTIDRLDACLGSVGLTADGLRLVRDHLAGYRSSGPVQRLRADAARVGGLLDEVRYAVRIKGPRVTVTVDEVPTEDFSSHVDRTFERLAQQATRSRLAKFQATYGMDHIEAAILDRVARLCPEPFADLSDFAQRYVGFPDEVLTRFDAEIQFFLAYLAMLDQQRARGIRFTLPEIVRPGSGSSADGVDEFGSQTVDLALAIATPGKNAPVNNDFAFSGPERVLVVSGPNQGGKTTFARSVGQTYHLAALGCPVAAARARLAVPHGIFTHFERMEEYGDAGGKLEDDLRRIHQVLEHASERSVVIINEIFTSTTLADAEFLGGKIIDQLSSIGTRCVYVTFVDPLAELGPHTVSMVSRTAEDDPTRRTFKVVRHEPGGKIYAQAIARRYGLSRSLIAEGVQA